MKRCRLMNKFNYIIYYLLLTIILPLQCAAKEKAPGYPVNFVKGFSWGWTGTRGDYLGAEPDYSLKNLAATGTEWIALAFAAHMETKSTPKIMYSKNNKLMVSDEEICYAIKMARKFGFKILMKPVVNCRDGAWRATINFESDKDWDKWWQNYEAFLLHYLQISIKEKCEMFCIGCEMRSTEGFDSRWRCLIAKVRETYKNPVVYNANHDDINKINWWDAVDIIGISAYYPVATTEDTSMEKMLNNWKPIRKNLKKLSKRWNKPVLFIEIGVRSARTCSTMPWDWQNQELPYDGEEQARFYEAAFQSFWEEPWFIGYCWWDWKAHLYPRGEYNKNRDFCVYGKPAEKVLRKWYAKPTRRSKNLN